MCALTSTERAQNRQDDQLDVEHEAEIATIKHIKTNPMVHFPDAAGLAAATGDLRQTGYSRLHGGAQDVVRDQVHEGPIELLHVRPGADPGPITEQDIN